MTPDTPSLPERPRVPRTLGFSAVEDDGTLSISERDWPHFVITPTEYSCDSPLVILDAREEAELRALADAVLLFTDQQWSWYVERAEGSPDAAGCARVASAVATLRRSQP